MENQRNTGGGFRRRWDVSGDGFGRNNMMMTSASFYTSTNNNSCLTSSDVNENVCNMFSSLSILPETVRTPVFSGESSGHRFYSGVGECTNVMVDPHHGFYYYDPMWYNSSNSNNNREVGFSGFDQKFDFDYLTHDLHRKEKVNLDESVVVPSFSMVSSRLRNHQVLSELSLRELRGRIYSLAKDQNGCRLLQGKFENPSNEDIEMVLYEVLDSISELMKDQFGNYLVQKLITVCNDDHKLRILLSLTDVPYEMVLICMSPHGTRAMQKLLENLNDPHQIALAMAALRPGAARLANDPNGHHVIQYCLIHFPSDVNEPSSVNLCYELKSRQKEHLIAFSNVKLLENRSH
ncbi:armadillo-type fold protein [Artemisia annua]|uniref:Armadillo-type fold protein n=1 Tax=Artemisia annua TaxID=35608 RepID=A0A2U1KHD8_ARTAN|nr:armadillo-type fold protein [Artemisia annua]